jgi:hypothetical protein
MLTMPHSKTQTAIEYCWRFRDAHPDFHVFWINAGSIARFDTDYRRLAKKLGLPCHSAGVEDHDMRDGVKDWLDENENWLMVIDNADRYDDFFAAEEDNLHSTIAEVLPWPRVCTALVICTSRHDRVGAQLSGDNCVRLDVMSESEGEAVFRAKFKGKADDEEVLRLLVDLDFLPLSIAHAGAYLEFTKISIDAYLSQLETSDEGLLDILGQDIEAGRRDSRAPRSVIKACQISLELLWRLNRSAANLFSLMACLERTNIRQEVFSLAGSLQLTKDGISISALDMNVELPQSQGDRWTAIGEISSLALITRRLGQNEFSMHRHVQAIAIRRLSDEGRLLTFCELSALPIMFTCKTSGRKVEEYFDKLSPTMDRVGRLLTKCRQDRCDGRLDLHTVLFMMYDLAMTIFLRYLIESSRRSNAKKIMGHTIETDLVEDIECKTEAIDQRVNEVMKPLILRRHVQP